MTILVLTAMVVTAMTLIVHGSGTSWWLHRMGRRYPGESQPVKISAKSAVVIRTALFMIFLHFAEILLWAIAYLLVAADELQSFETAVYFSAVTFTTLGYGDITLSSNWRLLSGFEAINGIVLIGWTTAFLYTVLQRMWQAHVSMTGGTHE